MFSRKQQSQIQFFPASWFKLLGQKCRSCNQFITQSNSISICSCNMFCHEKCFIQAYCTEDKLSTSKKIICTQCLAIIKFLVPYKTTFQFDFNQSYIGPVVGLTTVIIILWAWATLGYTKQYLSDHIMYLILFMLTFGFLSFLLYNCIKKQIEFDKLRCVTRNVQNKVNCSQMHLKQIFTLNPQNCVSDKEMKNQQLAIQKRENIS